METYFHILTTKPKLMDFPVHHLKTHVHMKADFRNRLTLREIQQQELPK
jgi:hypothetical protein